MADGEQLKLLAMVQDAKKVIRSIQYDTTLSSEQSMTLEDLSIVFEQIEDTLIIENIEQRVTHLEDSSKKLATIVTELQEETEKLSAICEQIDKIVKCIINLMDIITSKP